MHFPVSGGPRQQSQVSVQQCRMMATTAATASAAVWALCLCHASHRDSCRFHVSDKALCLRPEKVVVVAAAAAMAKSQRSMLAVHVEDSSPRPETVVSVAWEAADSSLRRVKEADRGARGDLHPQARARAASRQAAAWLRACQAARGALSRPHAKRLPQAVHQMAPPPWAGACSRQVVLVAAAAAGSSIMEEAAAVASTADEQGKPRQPAAQHIATCPSGLLRVALPIAACGHMRPSHASSHITTSLSFVSLLHAARNWGGGSSSGIMDPSHDSSTACTPQPLWRQQHRRVWRRMRTSEGSRGGDEKHGRGHEKGSRWGDT